MATTSNHYIIILCGGTGPRLWPLSYAHHPKQFLSLFDKKTLLEQTFNRAKKICPTKNIYIISNKRYSSKIEKILGRKLSSSNFIYEPEKKNTTMAILLALSFIQKINPQAIVIALPSDHYIQKKINFKKNIHQAINLATKQNRIITIGIKPSFPNISYGYILPQQKNQVYSNVSLFIEKPDYETAQNLIKKGAYWNSGIYIFTLFDMISEIEKLQPQYFSLYQKLISSKEYSPKSISDIYKKSLDLPIDKSISEKSDKIFVIPATFKWSDIGEWKSIYQNSKVDQDGHGIINSQTEYLSLDSKNCLVNGPKGKLIGLVGVNNLAVIDTPTGLLICQLDQSYNVRNLITLMVKNKKYKQYFLKK